MPAVSPGQRTTVPTHLVTAPLPPAHMIERPELDARIEQLVAAHRITLLIAPAGFGKTAALTAWAASTPRQTAWLSLSAGDRHPAHLQRSLAAAMEQLDLSAEAPIGDWPVLVIDDIHLVDPETAREVLHLERAIEPVRLLLAGRHEPKLGFAALHATGELGRLGPDDLALSEVEIGLAAQALGRPVEPAAAAAVYEQTHGWPVAVRLALMGGDTPGSRGPTREKSFPQIADYLVESTLAQLPPRLSAFVQAACICDWVSADLASNLTGERDSARLLEQAVELGLPVQRHQVDGRAPVYRWHPVMAQAGRALLMRHDPSGAKELHRRAARLLATADPYEAAAQALLGNAPELAAELIGQQWLPAVLRGDSELVNELCTRLPAPYSDNPEILVVRALCRRNAGDADAAASLAGRAMISHLGPAEHDRGRFSLTWMLARLFLADNETDLGEACAEGQAFLDSGKPMDGVVRASALFLLGWSLMRLRSADALPVLREAALRCRAEQLDDLTERAEAEYAFCLAFAGQFAAARAAIEASRPVDRSPWRRADGDVETFSLGWVAFYRGERKDAATLFRRAAGKGGALTSFAPFGWLWLVYTALDGGDPDEVTEAEQGLVHVPTDTVQGLPWRPYTLVAQAGLRLFRGDRDGAAALLHEVVASEVYIPATRALAAEYLWECGEVAAARATAESLAESGQSFVQASALTVVALCADAVGEDPHPLLARALAAAAEEGVARPFCRRDERLGRLLAEHAHRGCVQEAFLARVLALRAAEDHDRAELQVSLSAREREILGHLATTMSAAEICQLLYISPNTLKTHTRSIYRKLGVDSRRDAVRRFREERERGSVPGRR